MSAEDPPNTVEEFLGSPDLVVALESDRFKQFLDQVPIAVAVSQLNPTETVI